MSTVVELTDKNYKSFIEKTDAVVFIDFYSNSCAPCQTLLAFLPNIAEHYKDKEVVIAKVNVPLNPKLSKKFMLQSVPLSVIIGKDKMVKHAEVGLLSIDGYFNMIDKERRKGTGFFSRFLKK